MAVTKPECCPGQAACGRREGSSSRLLAICPCPQYLSIRKAIYPLRSAGLPPTPTAPPTPGVSRISIKHRAGPWLDASGQSTGAGVAGSAGQFLRMVVKGGSSLWWLTIESSKPGGMTSDPDITCTQKSHHRLIQQLQSRDAEPCDSHLKILFKIHEHHEFHLS